MKAVSKSCEQCLLEFSQALDDLRVYVQKAKVIGLTESQARELIASFEVTHDLGLEVLHKYFEQENKGPYSGSRDLTVEAFHADLIHDGKAWLDMIIDRIKYSPIYEIDTQTQFIDNIQKRYTTLFNRFEDNMGKIL